jgi:hypothetical protein
MSAEKDLARVRADIGREETTLAMLRAEYDSLLAGIEAEVRRGLDATAATRGRVEAGEVTLTEFLKTGLDEKAIRAKATQAAREKLETCASIIRAKRHTIFELEANAAALAYNIAYQAHATPAEELTKKKKEAETLQQALNPLAEGVRLAWLANDRAKDNLRMSEGKRANNLTWDSLTVPEIRDLLFDPRIDAERLPEIEAFLATAEQGATYKGLYVTMTNEAGTKPFIAFTKLGGPR